jgi:hypothetical protein
MAPGTPCEIKMAHHPLNRLSEQGNIPGTLWQKLMNAEREMAGDAAQLLLAAHGHFLQQAHKGAGVSIIKEQPLPPGVDFFYNPFGQCRSGALRDVYKNNRLLRFFFKGIVHSEKPGQHGNHRSS